MRQATIFSSQKLVRRESEFKNTQSHYFIFSNANLVSTITDIDGEDELVAARKGFSEISDGFRVDCDDSERAQIS